MKMTKSLALDIDLVQDAIKYGKETGRSLSGIVNDALLEYMTKIVNNNNNNPKQETIDTEIVNNNNNNNNSVQETISDSKPETEQTEPKLVPDTKPETEPESKQAQTNDETYSAEWDSVRAFHEEVLEQDSNDPFS